MQNFDVSIPMLSLADNSIDIDEKEIRTRKGYLAADCLKALETALQDASVVSMGKCIHFTADIVCSGGYALWKRFCYEYSIDHIGIASMKIFGFLISSFNELDKEFDRLPDNEFYANELIQKKIGQIILVIQQSPRRGKLKWPTVGKETHRNSIWLSGVRRAPDSSAVQKIWIRSSDLMELFIAGNEMIYACKEGALERALFWIKWTYEEDAAIKKENGGGLTTSDHGIALSAKNGKGRATPINFLMLCAIEAYKEAATTGTIKMNQEVSSLFTLYKNSLPGLLTGRKKIELLVILIQILCEVPKWKNPIAGPLVKDVVVLTRTVAQVPLFFREILALAPPKKQIKKVGKPKKKKVEVGPLSTEAKLNMIDAMVNQYHGGNVMTGSGIGR